jgi:hypothetical protein
VLAAGRPAARWRAKRTGSSLTVTVEALDAVDRDALQAEADRLAPLRGCTTAQVV